MREVARNNGQTYFVTSNAAGRQCFFRHGRWAELLIETLLSYRPAGFALHGFTVMPDHFHVVLTPTESLEKAVQLIKGGFSFMARKQFAWKGDVWVTGFSDHRIRDERDFAVHVRYIEQNAVKAGLVDVAAEYAYCSASGRFVMDAMPQGLKPQSLTGMDGVAEATPFQNRVGLGQKDVAEATPLQSGSKGRSCTDGR